MTPFVVSPVALPPRPGAPCWAPVTSPMESVRALEGALVSLYRAHLAVLADPPDGELGDAIAAMQRFYADWPYLADEPRRHPPEMHLFGRPDIVLSNDGPKVVETNFDTAVSGYEKPDAAWCLAAERFDMDPAAWGGRPLAGLRNHFEHLAGRKPCFVHWVRTVAAAPECEPILAFLNENGCGIQHIAHYAGEPAPAFSKLVPSYLHRACTLYTVNRHRARFERTLRSLVPFLHGATVPLGLSVLQSKLFLACLSDPRTRPPALTPDEIHAVETLIPPTRTLRQLYGAEWERVCRSRGDFVLKRSDSHEGRHVVFGCNLPQEEWENLLRNLPESRPGPDGVPPIWLVQERVRPREYSLLEYREARCVERRSGLSCSPYMFGPHLRGFETWRLPFVPNHEMLEEPNHLGHLFR
ncbi:hypothetical protein LVJ94_30020 [Pendulispora rubella]|uniref:Uncharacterized protein n=1 Tax=Pendulispora rubella TaxID=2741070 RepID=A0ABZ2KR59_9BACT